jgi:hypothetical protein
VTIRIGTIGALIPAEKRRRQTTQARCSSCGFERLRTPSQSHGTTHVAFPPIGSLPQRYIRTESSSGPAKRIQTRCSELGPPHSRSLIPSSAAPRPRANDVTAHRQLPASADQSDPGEWPPALSEPVGLQNVSGALIQPKDGVVEVHRFVVRLAGDHSWHSPRGRGKCRSKRAPCDLVCPRRPPARLSPDSARRQIVGESGSHRCGAGLCYR